MRRAEEHSQAPSPCRCPSRSPSLTSMAPGRSRRGPARGSLRRVPAVALAPAQRPPHPARPRPLASARGSRPIRARASASRLPAQRERLGWPCGGSARRAQRCAPIGPARRRAANGKTARSCLPPMSGRGGAARPETAPREAPCGTWHPPGLAPLSGPCHLPLDPVTSL